jgi:hypothetical protein
MSKGKESAMDLHNRAQAVTATYEALIDVVTEVSLAEVTGISSPEFKASIERSAALQERVMRAAPRLSAPDAARLQMALFILLKVQLGARDGSIAIDGFKKQTEAVLVCVQALCEKAESDAT